MREYDSTTHSHTKSGGFRIGTLVWVHQNPIYIPVKEYHSLLLTGNTTKNRKTTWYIIINNTYYCTTAVVVTFHVIVCMFVEETTPPSMVKNFHGSGRKVPWGMYCRGGHTQSLWESPRR